MDFRSCISSVTGRSVSVEQATEIRAGFQGVTASANHSKSALEEVPGLSPDLARLVADRCLGLLEPQVAERSPRPATSDGGSIPLGAERNWVYWERPGSDFPFSTHLQLRTDGTFSLIQRWWHWPSAILGLWATDQKNCCKVNKEVFSGRYAVRGSRIELEFDGGQPFDSCADLMTLETVPCGPCNVNRFSFDFSESGNVVSVRGVAPSDGETVCAMMRKWSEFPTLAVAQWTSGESQRVVPQGCPDEGSTCREPVY